MRLLRRRFAGKSLGLVLPPMVLLVALGSLAAGQEEDELSPYRPGMVATYAVGGQTVTRTDEVLAFDWQDAACEPRLPSGDFLATWQGRLWARGSGTYRLQCYVQGEVAIRVAGKQVLAGKPAQPKWLASEPLELEFDHHPLEITFRKTQAQAQLALFWSGPDFQLEPVPARALVHEKGQSPSANFERGRQLAAALRCAACHAEQAAASVTPAPALDRLSGNIHESWLIEWLASRPATPSGPAAEQASRSATAVNHTSSRRMPHLALTRDEATAIAAWLLREPALKSDPKQLKPQVTKAAKREEKTKTADVKGAKKAREEKPQPSAAEGERLIMSRGCLACHQLGALGESGLFGGGDLTQLLSKRPSEFLTRWLADSAAINRHHRMPVFTFTPDELTSLALWARRQAEVVGTLRVPSAVSSSDFRSPANVLAGERLVKSFRCGSCHVLARNSSELVAANQPPLRGTSNWSKSCGDAAERANNRPGYELAAADRNALQAYYSQPRLGERALSAQARGRDLLVQHNCLACHQREGIERATNSLPALLQDKLVAVAEAHGELAPLVPAMTPPALNSVGDKLNDAALVESISREGKPHRPYLLVQMPKFKLTQAELASLTAYFTATDRIPPVVGTLRVPLNSDSDGTRSVPTTNLLAAGPRLVTTDGLACTSCHAVGSVQPAKAPLNARGPDLSMLAKRIRREWFDRWCDNPARIVPRMEMPSVKVPVRGVLNDNVHDQLAAVWHILNTPGFEPPEPNPVRTLRLSGVPERNERPLVIHDIFKDNTAKDGDKTYLFPLVIGLPNRHNILFDLETNRLAAWWLGDTARQRTKGKSWYWEMGGKSISSPGPEQSEISLVVDGKEYSPEAVSQRPVAALSKFGAGGFTCELHFRVPGPERLGPGAADVPGRLSEHELTIKAEQLFTATPANEVLRLGSGFERSITLSGFGLGNSQIRFRIAGAVQSPRSTDSSQTVQLNGVGDPVAIFSDVNRAGRGVRQSNAQVNPDGSVDFFVPELGLASGRSGVAFGIRYATTLPADRYESASIPPRKIEATTVDVARGFIGKRLALSDDLMPSALAWDLAGQLYFATLKGQVFRAVDSDGDNIEESQALLIDGLPTPYGLAIANVSMPRGITFSYVDVLAKTGLLRLAGTGFLGKDAFPTSAFVTASGWGATDDYHDWAVGLVQGVNGEYYVALPCQQDQRSAAAAKFRGSLLKIVPSSASNPHIEVVSSGHRFPMGMARNREGELFVTDNQGNYNPFNELNHVRKGAHFGFINALEKEQGFQPPPLSEPAIDIPHPWTRSVNGICFLDTPVGWDQRAQLAPAHQSSDGKSGGPASAEAALSHPTKSIYGPLEGHLIGCEYDTRRLIRMSLQKIGDTYQGCAYPLSIPTDDVEKGLLGPIVCAIKPTTGELYVGEIRDSGWGAANNIGQIVKIKIEPEKLPCGIAEVRATHTGFTIDFFQPVDRAKAADPASYSLESYRRESTPAYGGPDIDRRTELVTAAQVSADGKRVTLTLADLRARHNYELKLKNLTPGGGMFHPDEAHYTLRQIPD